MSAEKRNHPLLPTEIAGGLVADAMMSAQLAILEGRLGEGGSKWTDPAKDSKDLDTRLAEMSTGACEEASVYVIYRLLQRLPSLFPIMSIVKGHPAHNSPLKNNPHHSFHAYFLLRDVQEYWHAGSPANHVPSSPDTPLTRRIYSPDLGEVMKIIKDKDGGEWPDPEKMQETLRRNVYKPPWIYEGGSKTFLNVFTFDDSYHGLETVTKKDGTKEEYRHQGYWINPYCVYGI